jgi:25S rRNA (uracil2843-N3)-methyltransferase
MPRKKSTSGGKPVPKPKATARPPASAPEQALVSPAVQQRLLGAFIAALSPLFDADDGGLRATVRAVKKSLYERDFAGAFATPQRRMAYVARWSAARAVGYAAVFAAALRHVDKDAPAVCCLGGGAGAELAGLTAVANRPIVARLVDAADWSAELARLHDALAAIPNTVALEFRHRDVLDLAPAELRSLLAGAGLVTLMFTLNELFTASVRRATALLLALRSAIAAGGLLLVVDSAGSYATVQIGGAEKRYPMQWLLDHTMLGDGWTKIRGEDSTWFRVPRELEYPLELENMRYQFHLYRRSDSRADPSPADLTDSMGMS